MKFRYIGDNVSLVMFGLEFVGDKPVEVTDERVIGKLSNNSHFSEVKSRSVKNGNKGGDSGQSGAKTGDKDSGTSAE